MTCDTARCGVSTKLAIMGAVVRNRVRRVWFIGSFLGTGRSAPSRPSVPRRPRARAAHLQGVLVRDQVRPREAMAAHHLHRAIDSADVAAPAAADLEMLLIEIQ